MRGRTSSVLLACVLLLSACAAPVGSTSPGPTGPPTAPTATTPEPTAGATPASSQLPAASPSSVPSAPASPGLSPSSAQSPAASVPGSAFDPGSVKIDLTPFATGLDMPVYATGARDGSGGLLVIEQAGRIRIVDSDGTLEATPFLDITDRVLSGGERGLLGLALHPDYENNGRFFVDYTRQPDGATVISEFQADDRFADPSSERILLTIPQPFPNHNGGMLAFDTEGKLLIGMGDGGDAGDPQRNGQNTKALLAKLLRIDVDTGNPYGIPADNPFATNPDFAPEVWDYGLRNPWRFSFDRLTGDLFIGDVGQDTYEEVDAEPALQGGHNFGWNVMEGTHCYGRQTCDPTKFTLPVIDYRHATDCSVTGGYVYRGTAFPVLQGGYLFGDYCSGSIRAISAADALANGHAPASVVGEGGFPISSFGQDDAGELYVVDLSGNVLKVTASRR